MTARSQLQKFLWVQKLTSEIIQILQSHPSQYAGDFFKVFVEI